MTISPGTSAVRAAELRLEQSRQRLQREVAQVRATLTRPTGLVTVVAFAGLIGFWLTGRARRARRISAAVRSAFPWRGIVFTLLIRHVAQRLFSRMRSPATRKR